MGYDYEKRFLQSLLLQFMNSDGPVFPNCMGDGKQNSSPRVTLENGAFTTQPWPPVALVYSPFHANRQRLVNVVLRQNHASGLLKWEDVLAFVQIFQEYSGFAGV